MMLGLDGQADRENLDGLYEISMKTHKVGVLRPYMEQQLLGGQGEGWRVVGCVALFLFPKVAIGNEW